MNAIRIGTSPHARRFIWLLGALLAASLLVQTEPPAASAQSECPSGLVALTFDDGPGVYTADVLDALSGLGIPGTFFVLGNNVEERPELVARAAAEGHEVANHSYTHTDFMDLTYEEVQEEVLLTDQAIRDAGTTPLELLRPPYGHWDGPGGSVESAVQSVGYEVVTWTYSPTDYLNTADVIRERVRENLHDGMVVLLHDGVSNAPEMIAALPGIAEDTRAAGYCFGLMDAAGNVVPAEVDNGFRDIHDSTHVDQIRRIAAAGITVGCNPPDNDLFCPEDPVTREQMASFLERALDLPAGDPDQFVDVDPTDTHAHDIDALGSAGITRGCNPPANDRFCPKDPVTRDQRASVLDRAGLTD